MDNSNLIALLPFKRHSSRVPNKNFKLINNRPLFYYILNNLLAVESIDLIVINTDAPELLSEHAICNDDKIAIKPRKQHLCGDDVSMNLIIQDDIISHPSTTYLMTHTTNPLLSSSTIDRALSSYLDSIAANKADSLFSVNTFQSRFYDSNCTPINHDPDNLIPTQELPIWYEENSCLYIFSPDSFAATDARIGLRPFIFPTPKTESIDIDTLEDWELAECLLTSQLSSRS